MKFPSSPIAEIIAVGDELTSGQRLDTNSQWLSRELNDLGIEVGFHTTVGDNLDHQTQTIRTAVQRAELILVTGGLGPTQDDLTREAIAQAAGVPLVTDKAALAHIESIFARNRRPMSDANRKQAQYPDGGQTIHNEEGTAPGVICRFTASESESGDCLLFAFPGVPYEMKKMWADQVEPKIAGLLTGDKVIRHHVIRCFGIGESESESRMPELIARDRSPRVGITASFATISFRITATAETDAQCHTQIDETANYIRETLGDVIFGEGETDLQTVTANLLAANQQTVALIDFQFGGAAASLLRSANTQHDSVVAASHAFDALTPARWLDCDTRAQRENEVTLVQAAQKLRFMLDTPIGVAIGPLDGTDSDNQPREFLVAIGFADASSAVETFAYKGHSEMRDIRSAKQVVDFIRRSLLARPSNPECENT